MLKVVDLETYIEQYHILQGVTFDVQPGEITVLELIPFSFRISAAL